MLLAIPVRARLAALGRRRHAHDAGTHLGIGFFLLQRLIESGTVVFNLNPVVLAWLPTALLAVVTLGLLARAR